MGWERLGTAATHLLDRPPPSLSQVLRTTPRLASVEIVTVGDVPLPAPLAGVIRCAERRGARCAKAGPAARPAHPPSPPPPSSQDVRLTEVDTVVLADCFRPGDVVRAAVASLGDARSYHLTTAAPPLGVVHATSLAGAPLDPVSWCEMRCPVTQATEKRKVAAAVENA